MTVYRMSQKWRTNGALRCRRDYRKRQKNLKKILLDLFADLAVFESGTQHVILKYMYEIVMTATVNFKIIEYTSKIKKSIYYSFFRM
jgi:hypothetical protein